MQGDEDEGKGKQALPLSSAAPILQSQSMANSQTGLLKIHGDPSSDEVLRVTAEQLGRLVDPKSVVELAKLGGVTGLAAIFKVDLKQGIKTKDQDEELRALFGANVLPHPQPPTLLWFIWLAMNDRILIFLTIAAIVSLGIGIWKDIQEGTQTHWIEGAAIMMAVVLVVMVNAVNDWQKDRQFRALSAKNDDRLVRVVRGGNKVQISVYDVVVGDVVLLDPGDVLPADGVLIEGHGVSCDESGATGESDTVKKDPHRDPFFLSGTKVLDGSGTMLAIAVGEGSFHGRMMMAMQVESSLTPLQAKLSLLAEIIARFGFSAALFMLLSLVIKFIVHGIQNPPWPPAGDIVQELLEIVIQAVTVVVVAVPEGLPMAVTLALAFATTRMLKDNNLVRILAACETMGSASTICSDKTGTLTENRMTVVRGLVLDQQFTHEDQGGELEVSRLSMDVLAEGLATNSSAFSAVDVITQRVSFVGSKTEAALLGFLARRGYDFADIRTIRPVVRLWPFASERKRMSTLIKTERPNGHGCLRVHCKGASEIVLARCSQWMGPDGSIKPLDEAEKARFLGAIESMASDGLRTISVAYRDFSEDEDSTAPDWSPDEQLTLLAILGIEDPLRPGVHEAVKACQRAGIFVRMVTGDNALTARSIASRCGIYTRGGIVMEGPAFRQLSDEALTAVVPRLQVLARSSPLDKQILVRKLRAMGEVVAVTGDGTNDGPALRAANVGFAMGIAGTEVAKAAADIVLMDDNFTSIVRAVSWGRCVNDSVRKFLQFQLTVNAAAVVVAIVSALAGSDGRSALSAVQLLWVNLIMDSFAALALATDYPTPDLLERAPEPTGSPLITPSMWAMILGQAAYQIAAMLSILFWIGPSLLSADDSRVMPTFVFNTFVFMQLFNELNCRCLGRRFNIFAGILRNWIFLAIWFGTVAVQVLLVFFGGAAFNTDPIPLTLWLISIGMGLVALPLGALIRCLPSGWTRGPTPRVFMSPERIRWQAAAENVRRGLSVVRALRRSPQAPPPL